MCLLRNLPGGGPCSLQTWRTVAHRQRRGAWVRPRRAPDSAVWALLYAAKPAATLETNLPVSSVNISLIPQKDDYACNLTTCHINLGSLRLLLIRLSKHGGGGGGGIVVKTLEVITLQKRPLFQPPDSCQISKAFERTRAFFACWEVSSRLSASAKVFNTRRDDVSARAEKAVYCFKSSCAVASRFEALTFDLSTVFARVCLKQYDFKKYL